MVEVLAGRSSFHKLARPELKTVQYSTAGLPPTSLSVRRSIYIMQMRTGFWTYLGAHTYLMSELRELHCQYCHEVIEAKRGRAVLHLFSCKERDKWATSPWAKSRKELESLVNWAISWSGRVSREDTSESDPLPIATHLVTTSQAASTGSPSPTREERTFTY